MAKKIYTLTLDEKNLQTSVSKKSEETKKPYAQKEVEEFGIVEINNGQATKKIKNKNDVGYEKVLSNTNKKQVKNNIHQVDDYFDFSFRPETKKVAESKSEKSETVAVKTTKKEPVKSSVKSETEVVNLKASIAVPSIDPKHIEDAKTYKTEETERTSYDEAASYNVSVARMGALFDCEKRMLN